MNLEQIRRTYDRRAASYDRSIGLGERLLVGDLRRRFGGLLAGETLEVAVESGLNLPYYSGDVTRAVGVDLSPGMLAEARSRAEELGRAIELVEGDAQRLPFADASFDTVAVSLGLCTVPEPALALGEMARVCRPGGRIVLLEHVRATPPPLVWLQVLLSPVQERLIGCHLARATCETAREMGFGVEEVATRFAGVFRLAVLTATGERKGRNAGPSSVMSVMSSEVET